MNCTGFLARVAGGRQRFHAALATDACRRRMCNIGGILALVAGLLLLAWGFGLVDVYSASQNSGIRFGTLGGFDFSNTAAGAGWYTCTDQCF